MENEGFWTKNKTSRILIICSAIVLLLSSCASNRFYRIVARNNDYSRKIYDRYLDTYGNASMLEPEGNFSRVWYYHEGRIYVTNIVNAKTTSIEDFECPSMLNIKEYTKGCYPEALDAEGFGSSVRDAKTDSIQEIYVCLVVDDLISKGSDCPTMGQLRDHILRYNLWPMTNYLSELSGSTITRKPIDENINGIVVLFDSQYCLVIDSKTLIKEIKASDRLLREDLQPFINDVERNNIFVPFTFSVMDNVAVEDMDYYDIISATTLSLLKDHSYKLYNRTTHRYQKYKIKKVDPHLVGVDSSYHVLESEGKTIYNLAILEPLR